MDGVLLKPLPYQESDRLVSLRLPVAEYQRLLPSGRMRLRAIVEQTPLLQDHATEEYGGLYDSGDDAGLVERAISPNLFQLLGVAPILGSGFSGRDGSPGRPAIVIGYDIWRTRFGADPDITGREVTLQGRRAVVVGVMPPGFDFPRGTTVWSSMASLQRQSIPSVARLAHDATVAQLRAELTPIEVRLLEDVIRPKGGLTLVLLLAGSGFLLLIAWTQVAAVQLARFPERVREIGVRLALGASRAQVVRQFAAEAVILAALALSIAWPLSRFLTDAATALLPADMVGGRQITADIRVFAFACGLSILGVLICAVVPAVFLLRHPAASSLRGEVFTGNSRAAGSRVRQAL